MQFGQQLRWSPVIPPYRTRLKSRWVYRLVVCFLGLTVIGTVAGGFIITGKSAQSIPEGLIALGSAAVGALAGLLAPSPGSR
jgi:hypothetical protein